MKNGDEKKKKKELIEELAVMRRRMAEHQSIFDSVPAMIWYKDKNNKILRCNRPAAEARGMTVAEMEGRYTEEFYPDEAAKYLADDLEVINSGRPKLGIIEPHQVGSGEKIWVRTDKIPYRDEDGNIIGVIVFAIDITQLKRTEEELAAEKERLAVTLRSIGDGVIATDASGRVVLMNEIAEKLSGWTHEEAMGKMLHDVFNIINEQTRVRCEDPVEKVLKNGTIVALANHTVLIDRDGTERVIADSGAPIRDREGNIIGVVLVFRDTTEQQRLAEELMKATKLESIGLLAGGIAHDFNNLLTAIIGNLSLAMISAYPQEDLFQRLSEIEKASLLARNLTQQLLTFSKGGTPIIRTVSVAEQLKETATFVLRGSNIKCELSIPDDLWLVDIDQGQINQVVSNLVINAQQAMPDGGIIEVTAENIMSNAVNMLPLQAQKYVRISIKDHGIGIQKENLQKIFDPYFTTKKGGSGLGLATCYSIMKRHDGYIAVESEVGIGSTFHIYLPASETKFLPGSAAQERFARGQGKILVMDDHDNIRVLVKEMLSRFGYEVELAKDGTTAIDLYKKARDCGRPFDVVIMDLTVPGGMGGKEAIKRLLEIDSSVKAIVSSGYSNDTIMAEYREYGFSGVIVKPYRIEEMMSVLRKVIGGVEMKS
jgi:PAS domain S-box-containing protein